MSISHNDVQKVALLSRLELSGDDLRALTAQLGRIVGYVEQLSEVDTDEVPPMAHAIELANVFGEDVVQPSLSRMDALANAPHHDSQGYLVPAVLGD